MAKEERNWKPSRWKPEKLRRFLRHTHKYTVWCVCQLLGEYNGNLIAAQLQAEWKGQYSAAQLAARGVRTIGDK